MNNPCIFLMGPTASGKTDLAVSLVKQLPCDIVSVDSAMVYRGLDIGTAKPTADILTVAPHRLIDICDPADSYSAARFCHDALAEIQAIHAAGRLPLLVGGTGLYFRSLQQGLSDLPAAQPHIRQRLCQEAQQVGWAVLYQRLVCVDPIAAQRIHPHDPQRIQRALEVYEVSGYPMTTWFTKNQIAHWPYPVIKIVLAPAQRSVLHARITQRFKTMLAQGLIEEVRSLWKRGDLNLTLPALKTVGYRQVWQYLLGELDQASLSEKAISATRQLAKRQLTWLRRETETHWFDSQHPNVIQQVLKWLNQNPMLSQYDL